MLRRHDAAEAPDRSSLTVVSFTRATAPCYLQRAMVLWPRLDRARLRKVADDPARIAAVVVRRTSQPFDVILAMLTHQEGTTDVSTGEPIPLDPRQAQAVQARLRGVRTGRDMTAETRGRLLA
jgi:hypothetical protein